MDIKTFEIECIKLARKHNITLAEVKKIYTYQFKIVMDAIREDYTKPIEERRSIKVHGLGNFEFNPYLAKKLEQLKNKENDNSDKILPETDSKN